VIRIDAYAVFALRWASDRIEERYGRAVAWWATLAMCLSVIAVLVAFLFILL
jgi:hypothetical protein